MSKVVYVVLAVALVAILTVMKIDLLQTKNKGIGSDPKITYLNKMYDSEFGEFDKYSWYENLKLELVEKNILLTEIADRKIDSDKKYVVMTVKDFGYGLGPSVYRFDTINGVLEKAQDVGADNAMASTAGEFTSPYGGDVSEIRTHGGDAGCSTEQYFSYDVTANNFKLKKTMVFCEGDKEETWNENYQ